MATESTEGSNGAGAAGTDGAAGSSTTTDNKGAADNAALKAAGGAAADADKAKAGEKPALGGSLESEGEKPADKAAEAKAEAVDWDKWEAKAPDGIELDAELLKDARPIFKEAGLKVEHAQKLVDLVIRSNAAMAQKQQAAGDAQAKAWAASVRQDKEIGGEGLKQNLTAARGALQKFFGPEAIALIRDSALGDHPEIIRGFLKIAKASADDSIAGRAGGSGEGGLPTEDVLARQLFNNSPGMFSKEH